jgi:serine O-acetyltransferase
MCGVIEGLGEDIRMLLRGRSSPGSALAALLTNRGLHAILLYRMSHALWRRHVPLVPLVLTRLAQLLFAIDIAYQAELGPGIVIVHGFGLVIGSAVRIEGNCCLYHGVTLGDRGSEWVGSEREDGHPVVERDVMFGAGAKVLGPIHIGRNCVVGANAVLLADVPPCSIVAGVPARVVGTRPEMDENLRPIRAGVSACRSGDGVAEGSCANACCRSTEPSTSCTGSGVADRVEERA